jgi:hypothetical protein
LIEFFHVTHVRFHMRLGWGEVGAPHGSLRIRRAIS